MSRGILSLVRCNFPHQMKSRVGLNLADSCFGDRSLEMSSHYCCNYYFACLDIHCRDHCCNLRSYLLKNLGRNHIDHRYFVRTDLVVFESVWSHTDLVRIFGFRYPDSSFVLGIGYLILAPVPDSGFFDRHVHSCDHVVYCTDSFLVPHVFYCCA